MLLNVDYLHLHFIVLLCVFGNGMGMVITQWESHGNENNETGIPWEWEYDLNFGGGNGVEWELTAWE